MADDDSTGPMVADVVWGSADKAVISWQIVNELSVKGFCSIDTQVDEDQLDACFREMKQLDRAGHFVPVPMEILDGLLGSEGCQRVADLLAEDNPKVVSKLDGLMTEVADAMSTNLPMIGLTSRYRTGGVLIEAGRAKSLPALTDIEVARWQPVFGLGRIMLMLCIGPGSGKLTLQPIDGDANETEISTEPGMLVAIRADCLSKTHHVPGRKGYMLTSFMQVEGKENRAFAKAVLPKRKVVEKFDEWRTAQLKALKSQVDVDDIDNALAQITLSPATWRKEFDKMFHVAQKTRVAGMGVKYPSTFMPAGVFHIASGAADTIHETPIMRWDSTIYYDPEPDSWTRGKCFCNHGGWVDGADLFDTKFFKIAPAESKSMDPQQRWLLETGYESLYRAGRRQKDLLNSLTGVYTGVQTSEFPMIDAGPQEAGGCEQRAAGTGFAGAIMSNRFSFVLGMQGPSVMIDTDASSSLTSMQLSVASLFAGKVAATMSVAQGNATMMTPLTWLGRCASREMTPRGRAFTFDATTDGFVRADGGASIAVDNLLDVVDGNLVDDADKFREGVITSCVTSSNGVVATLNTPSGPQQIKLFAEACKQAGIAMTSVDAVECHGDGQLLHDAVEVESCRKVFASGLTEGGVEGRAALVLTNMKPNVGNGIQANMNSLIKVLFAQRAGLMAPCIHLQEMSPYIQYTDGDVETEQPSHITTEHLALSDRQSMIATNGFGFGGTICCAMLSGEIDSTKTPEAKTVELNAQLLFWPGGGGKLEDGQEAKEGYDIIGSWTGFETPERMEVESPGVYGYTVTLGANRMEKFKIILDGDKEKVLHAGFNDPRTGGPVMGPDANAGSWEIIGGWDGEMQALTSGETGEDSKGGLGDTYRLKMQIAGKWRMISWTKLASSTGSVEALMKDPLIEGTYYISGEFNSWGFEAMEKSADGTWTYDLKLEERQGKSVSATNFLIVRNKDWSQCFHSPGFFGSQSYEDDTVIGPDEWADARGASYHVAGAPGKVYKLTFKRSLESGSDVKTFSMSK